MKQANLFSEICIPGIGLCDRITLNRVSHRLQQDGEMTLVNIICPGYVKNREGTVEQFDFPALSTKIDTSPNVQLMIEKMLRTNDQLKARTPNQKLRTVMILADVAILNYKKLAKHQDVPSTMDQFFESIITRYGEKLNDVEFVKMSELPKEFQQIPLEGIKINDANSIFESLGKQMKKHSSEYIGSLLFARINESMSKNTEFDYEELHNQTAREVARFVREYGLAGLAISKLYPNPVILFTEPSGYMRGYFYNAYLDHLKALAIILVK